MGKYFILFVLCYYALRLFHCLLFCIQACYLIKAQNYSPLVLSPLNPKELLRLAKQRMAVYSQASSCRLDASSLLQEILLICISVLELWCRLYQSCCQAKRCPLLSPCDKGTITWNGKAIKTSTRWYEADLLCNNVLSRTPFIKGSGWDWVVF